MNLLRKLLCDVKVKRIKRQCWKVLIICGLALLYNEFLVYYLVLLSCHYPQVPGGGGGSGAVKVMVLADTHLLGSR